MVFQFQKVNCLIKLDERQPSSDFFQKLATQHYHQVTVGPNGPKTMLFDTKNHHSVSKNYSKIYISYLRDFLWKIVEIFLEIL